MSLNIVRNMEYAHTNKSFEYCTKFIASSRSILDSPFSRTLPVKTTTINALNKMAIMAGNVMLGLRYHGAFSPLCETKKPLPPNPKEIFLRRLR